MQAAENLLLAFLLSKQHLESVSSWNLPSNIHYFSLFLKIKARKKASRHDLDLINIKSKPHVFCWPLQLAV